MKISDAKLIPIQTLVDTLGGRYSHTDRKGELWYHSPFRPDEKTASFKINEKLNTWHDFGMSATFAHQKQGSGGDILDLWCDYHFKDRRLGIKDALVALKSLPMASNIINKSIVSSGLKKNVDEPAIKILRTFDNINYIGLLNELKRRRITYELANDYLKQAQIQDNNTGKKYVGFVFQNDIGGYELSIPNPNRGESFKSCIGSKAVTYLPPMKESHNAYVFEGFWDFLSWLEMKKTKKPLEHYFILNSTSMAKEVTEKISEIKDKLGYVFLFLDNDNSGYQTTHAMALAIEELGLNIASMEGFYKDHKDVSEYWMKSIYARLT